MTITRNLIRGYVVGNLKGVADGGVDLKKTLHGSRRLEPLHLALPSPPYLMGVFGSTVPSWLIARD
jgi:hypothetical protein